MRGVHGRGRYGPAAAQRGAHAAARCRSAARNLRQPHPERRHERGHARVDHPVRGYPLHHRFCGGAAPVSRHRGAFSIGDQRRNTRATQRPRRPRGTSPHPGLCGRGKQRSRGFLPFSPG